MSLKYEPASEPLHIYARFFLHPAPYTLYPTPYTLHLHPTPYTASERREERAAKNILRRRVVKIKAIEKNNLVLVAPALRDRTHQAMFR